MNLLLLAPDNQEALLFLPPVERGPGRKKIAGLAEGGDGGGLGEAEDALDWNLVYNWNQLPTKNR